MPACDINRSEGHEWQIHFRSNGIRTINRRDIGSEHRSDEDVSANEELAIDSEELGLVRELEEKGTDGWRTVQGRVCEQSVLDVWYTRQYVDRYLTCARRTYPVR